MSANFSTILHLSDLHLGENLNDTGRSSKAPSLWKGRFEMQTHDPFILAVLPSAVRGVARSVGAKDDCFDFSVITGDISATANSGPRFAFARQFLVAKLPWYPGFDTGLTLPPDRVFCVPGNHDKMMELAPDRYLSAFGNLPCRPPYVKQVLAQNGRQFIFYGIDSNLYSEGNIAVGQVNPPTLGWLGETINKIESRSDKEDDAVRILLLHHHPCDLNKYRRLSLCGLIRSFWKNRFTRLEEGDRLLEHCRSGIDIIMHGHEHFPFAFKDDQSGCLVVSAGTTSQFQKSGGVNSFHVLVFDGAEVRVVQFDWNRARFKKAVQWKYDLSTQSFSLDRQSLEMTLF